VGDDLLVGGAGQDLLVGGFSVSTQAGAAQGLPALAIDAYFLHHGDGAGEATSFDPGVPGDPAGDAS
jgi:hypothetical protein